jgi:hypothetical protein
MAILLLVICAQVTIHFNKVVISAAIWLPLEKYGEAGWYERIGLLKRRLQQKGLFNVYGTWCSPNTILTMAHGQAFCIIIGQPPIESVPPTSSVALWIESFEPPPITSNLNSLKSQFSIVSTKYERFQVWTNRKSLVT